MTARRKWTQEDREYLEKWIGVSSYKQIAKALNRSYWGVVIYCQRNNLSNSKTFQGHDFIVRDHFIKEMVEKHKVRHWLVSHMIKDGIIKSRKTGKCIMITLDEYEKWDKFFSKYVLAWDASESFKKLDHDYAETILYHWYEKGVLKSFKIPQKRQCALWFCKESLKQCTDIAVNYLILSDIARKTGWTKDHIRKQVKKKNIPFIVFAGRQRVHKKYLSEFRRKV